MISLCSVDLIERSFLCNNCHHKRTEAVLIIKSNVLFCLEEIVSYRFTAALVILDTSPPCCKTWMRSLYRRKQCNPGRSEFLPDAHSECSQRWKGETKQQSCLLYKVMTRFPIWIHKRLQEPHIQAEEQHRAFKMYMEHPTAIPINVAWLISACKAAQSTTEILPMGYREFF